MGTAEIPGGGGRERGRLYLTLHCHHQNESASTIPACPSLLCSLTGIILKGLILRKFVSDVGACIFYVCEVTGFVD